MNRPLPPPSLRPATLVDAAVALSWTPQDDALRRWAGPSTRCPATPETLWADITSTDASTFVFEAEEHDLIGFGQVRFREQTYGHLARIIVSPHLRGRGVGRALCLALMREAVRLHPIKAFSLFVFEDNAHAIELYRSLGFVAQGRHPQFPCILMQAPLSVVSSG